MIALRSIASAMCLATLLACATDHDDTGIEPGAGCEAGDDCTQPATVHPTTPSPSPTPTPTPTPTPAPQPWAAPTLQPWPGADAIAPVDPTAMFSTNMSDLFYEPGQNGAPDVMWAVKNGPSRLYRLVEGAGVWTPSIEKQTLRFPDGTGDVDAEGVTRAEMHANAIYVASERDNLIPLQSRLSVLRYDTSNTATTLVALQEWDLTNDLPEAYANGGFEAITWVPDTHLVAQRFVDETTGLPYVPAQYPGHGTGLFFVGLEDNGTIYAYALDHADGSFTRIATIDSGFPVIMGLAFDRDVGYLWAQCDNACENQMNVLAVDPAGKFIPRGKLQRPTSLANLNNEGVTFAPESRCVNGQRKFYWADDGGTGGHALRADTIPCGSFLP